MGQHNDSKYIEKLLQSTLLKYLESKIESGWKDQNYSKCHEIIPFIAGAVQDKHINKVYIPGDHCKCKKKLILGTRIKNEVMNQLKYKTSWMKKWDIGGLKCPTESLVQSPGFCLHVFECMLKDDELLRVFLEIFVKSNAALKAIKKSQWIKLWCIKTWKY